MFTLRRIMDGIYVYPAGAELTGLDGLHFRDQSAEPFRFAYGYSRLYWILPMSRR